MTALNRKFDSRMMYYNYFLFPYKILKLFTMKKNLDTHMNLIQGLEPTKLTS